MSKNVGFWAVAAILACQAALFVAALSVGGIPVATAVVASLWVWVPGYALLALINKLSA